MENQIALISTSFIVLGILMALGKWIRSITPLFRKIYLPASVISGVLALLAGPQVLGEIFNQEFWAWVQNGIFPQPILDVWAQLPGALINVIFACLFLGKSIPSLKKVWQVGGPHAAYGQTVAWGQYVIGIGLTLLVLKPFFNVDPMMGALIEIGFQGGHGTSAGLAPTFKELGFSEGEDLALGMATIGVVGGVLMGTFLINWAIRTEKLRPSGKKNSEEAAQDITDDNESEKKSISGSTSLLSIQMALISVSIAMGWLFLKGLVALENRLWGQSGGIEIFKYVPLFPMSMLGGVLVQVTVEKLGIKKYVDRGLINQVSGVSLDFIIISALATLSLKIIGANWIPVLVLATAGIAWNLFAFLFLARRFMPKWWFEKGICSFGQSMGMTVTGLLLLRIADPEGETNALESFGYKQLMFEPIVGGGLFTALSLPLIYNLGAGWVLFMTGILFCFWASLGFFYFGKSPLR